MLTGMKTSAENISIRRARAADANLISVLGAVTFYEAYFEQDEPPDLANYIAESFAPEKIRAELDAPTAEFFIIFRDGKAVGYAKLRMGEPHASVAGEKAVELQRIYLIERVFGTGAGEKLLNFCCREARRKGFETIWLGVWEENLRAQKFYAKHGFRQVGTLTFPYGNTYGVNLVLQRDLRR